MTTLVETAILEHQFVMVFALNIRHGLKLMKDYQKKGKVISMQTNVGLTGTEEHDEK